MNRTVSTLLIALALAAPAIAQQKPEEHAAHHPAGAASTPNGADMADAEVRKVDKPAGKITLKHGEIKTLDMPPMTMVFGVKDKAVLDRFKAGDKVRFKAVNDNGKYTVTDIEPAQ